MCRFRDLRHGLTARMPCRHAHRTSCVWRAACRGCPCGGGTLNARCQHFAFFSAPEDRRTIHRVAASAVAPGGTLLVVGHDRSNLDEGTGGPQDPEVLFTAAEVAAELPGLRIERAEVVRRPLGDGRWRIDAVACAVRPTG